MEERSNHPSGFLSDLTPRPWRPDSMETLRPLGLFVGQGANALEVVAAESSRSPNRNTLLSAWRVRRGGRASPVLLVVQYADGAALCGATGVTPPVYVNLDIDQVERLCREALQQPDRHAALRFLAQALPSLETALPGIRNEGLLALHELQHGVPRRADWKDAKRKAKSVLGKRDNALLRALGFQIERLDNLTSLLRSGTRRTALAVLLHESESAETGAARFKQSISRTSTTQDWYARRFVETHVNYFVFNPLPIPRPSRDDRSWKRVVALVSCPASFWYFLSSPCASMQGVVRREYRAYSQGPQRSLHARGRPLV